MSNETIKDQVRRLIAGIAPCYEKRPDLIKDDDYCFGFMVQVVELAIAEEREASGWKAIESAPKNRRILVFNGARVFAAEWAINLFTEEGAWRVATYTDEGDQIILKDATHWTDYPPLPAAPKAEVSE